MATHPTTSAGDYHAWYATARGRWIGETEFRLMMQLLAPCAGATLLDVGSGTGYFTQRFAGAGLAVAGLDRNVAMVRYARERTPAIPYLIADASAIPARDASWDYVTAATSLCFMSDPVRALNEMWRVARRAVLLGLLNRHSLLYVRKRGRGGYRGARWDTVEEVREWAGRLLPRPAVIARSAIFAPTAGRVAQRIERVVPGSLLWGGFLVVCLRKSTK